MASKSKKRNIILIISAVLIVLLVVLAMSKKKGSSSTKVSAEFPEKRTIVELVSANGKIQPEQDIIISPYISGEVVELYVKEGDKVNEGDLLAKIDPEIYITTYEQIEASLQMQKANLSNSKARLAQAQAQFEKAKEDYKRNKKLFEEDVISQSDFDGATSAHKVAEAEVKAAEETVKAAEFSVSSTEATLREAKENLNRTSIYAPSAGTVSRLNVEKGERVTGASQFSSGTEVMRIANLSRMIVQVEVNENDIVRVNLQDTCLIEVDAYLEHEFKGLVTEIATSANVTGISADQVTNFEVKILILEDSYQDMVLESDNIKSPFRPGMSATVDIQTETAIGILTVPIQAVTTRADTIEQSNTGGDENSQDVDADKKDLVEVVFILEEGKVVMKRVKTGIQDNMFIEVTEGLALEEEVITGPYRAVSKRLKEGDQVEKVDKKDLFSDEK